MQPMSLLARAVALAMDAFAVSIATGVSLKQVSLRQTFRLSWHFGFFQALMPVIGWSAGLTIRSHIANYDHWLAFVLLAFVGVKMIKEAIQQDKEKEQKSDPTKGYTLILLSVATSIDALAIGFSMSMLKISIWMPVILIGAVAAMFTAVGLYVGKKVGSVSRLSFFAEAIGGIILLLIGLNILREHGALPFL